MERRPRRNRDAEKEFEECINKAQAVINALEIAKEVNI